MSYCRWSSDNFECDLYCYQSDSGWITHVASHRHAGDIPKVDWQLLQDGKGDEFNAANKKQESFLESAELIPIGLPHDGETFCDDTLNDFLATVTMLKDAGYQIPEDLIGDVKEEMGDMKGKDLG